MLLRSYYVALQCCYGEITERNYAYVHMYISMIMSLIATHIATYVHIFTYVTHGNVLVRLDPSTCLVMHLISKYVHIKLLPCCIEVRRYSPTYNGDMQPFLGGIPPF